MFNFAAPTALALTVAAGLALMTPARADDAAANALFVGAVQTLQAAPAQADAAQRLAALDSVLSSLEQIVAEHPSSSLAVSLITGQAIGTIDPVELRRERDALLAASEADRARSSWVQQMILCAEQLPCVDAFLSEAFGEPFRVSPEEQAEMIPDIYRDFVLAQAQRVMPLSDEEALALEEQGAAVDVMTPIGRRQLRHLAVSGDPRVPALTTTGPTGSLIDDLVVQGVVYGEPATGAPISLAIQAYVADGPQAALDRVREVRAAVKAILAEPMPPLPSNRDEARLVRMIRDGLEELHQTLASEFLLVLMSMSMTDNGPYDDGVTRAALEMMLEDLGPSEGPQWGSREGYSHLAYFLASYGLRRELNPEASLSSYRTD